MKFKEEKLFDFIKKKVPKSKSYVEEISDVLDISYDAAYRRVNGKTTLSFEEALELTEHYEIPIHNLYDLSTDKSLFVYKNNYANSYKGLEEFYNYISESVNLFSKFDKSDMLYAAKDIPIYYIPGKSMFAKFKLYVYSNVLSDPSLSSPILFKDYKPKASIVKSANKFKESFRRITTTEIWNDATINSALYQIYYFFEIKLLSKDEALQLCDEFTVIIENVEKQASSEIWNKEKGLKYELFHNSLLSLDNTVFFRSAKINTLLVSYTPLSHIRIEDEKTCKEIEVFFRKQLKYSKKISGKAEVDRRLFFTFMFDKIEQLKKQIETKTFLSFI